MRKAQGRRLATARKAAGYRSARAAWEANQDFGWKESTYRAHESGDRTMGQDDAERYARRFRQLGVPITAREILFGSDGAAVPVQERRREPRVATLISWVSAGRLAESGDLPSGDAPTIPVPDLPNGDYIALTVRGDSMDRLSPEGSVIIVNRNDRTLQRGKPYVFAVRGEATYKLWEPGDPAYLAPFSTNATNKPIFVKRKRDLFVIGRVRRTILDL